MILHHPTPWKNTVAFRLSFDLRGLDIHRTHPGLLHFAEHLSFVSTKKFTATELGRIHSFHFDTLHATTSVSCLDFTVRCHSASLPIVAETLREMLHEWHCPRANFAEEKQTLLDEYQYDYIKKPFTQQVLNFSKKIPILKHRGIGTKQDLERLTYADVARAKKLWQSVITQVPRTLIVTSGPLTTRQKKILSSIIDLKKHQTVQNIVTGIKPGHKIETDKMIGVRFDNEICTPFFDIAQRIHYIRTQANGLSWRVNEICERGLRILYVEKPDKATKTAQKAYTLITAPPTKAEFKTAQVIIANHFESMADASDIDNLTNWLQDFWIDGPNQIQNKSLLELATVFKNYSYPLFVEDWKKAFPVTQ